MATATDKKEPRQRGRARGWDIAQRLKPQDAFFLFFFYHYSDYTNFIYDLVQGNDTGRDIHTRYTQHTEPTLATKKKVGGQVCKVDGDNFLRTVLTFFTLERRIFDYKGTGEETL